MRMQLVLMAVCLLCASTIHAENKSGVEPQVISLPKGPGSIGGLGESFEPMLNTGTATYEIKLTVPPGINRHQPEIALVYNSGNGNSPLGIGWDLNLPFIQRQTEKGLPRYNAADVFIYSSSGDLVPIGNEGYRLKNEGSFIRFLRVGNDWEAWEKNGTRLLFGRTPTARVANSRGVFKWLLERSIDSNGNAVKYNYFQHGGQAYLGSIEYTFVAGPLNLITFSYQDRNDAFTDYRSGAKVTTAKRLKRIEVFNGSSLVRRYELEYKKPAHFSLLHRVTQYGRDGVTGLPSMTFDYSEFDCARYEVVQMANSPGVSLKNANADLVDINGDSLPDVVYTPHEQAVKNYQFFINRGDGAFAKAPRISEFTPYYFLDSKAVQMADMDGDGLADLLVKDSTAKFGFYRSGSDNWSDADWNRCSPIPVFSFEDEDVRLVDLNHDGMTDVLKTGGNGGYTYWLNGKDRRWTADLQGSGPPYRFSDAGSRLRLGDMNGDGMEDLVYLGPYGVSYFPARGYGRYGGEVPFSDLVFAPYQLTGDQFQLNDLNNDGLCDLILIGDRELFLWLNRGRDGFGDPVELRGTPPFDPLTTAVRIADVDGDGLREVLYSGRWGAMEYVRFNRGVHPNLLTGIDNGLGMTIAIAYRSSTDYYVEAWRTGKPWKQGMRTPFPVQVVSRRVVTDKNSGQNYRTDFVYRDGYYDVKERQFRGFSSVDKIEYGDRSAPGLKTHHVFDVGKTDESRKGFTLETSTLEKDGRPGVPEDTFVRVRNTLRTRKLASGTNGKDVHFSFVAQADTSIFEGKTTPKKLRSVYDYDGYGNQIKNYNYGQIKGADLGFGQDELLTSTQYHVFTGNGRWIVDRPGRILKKALDNHVLSETRSSYDDRGNLTLQNKWVKGDHWVATQNNYDEYGNIIQMTDANGHWRKIAYDSTAHSFPVSETIGKAGLVVRAAYDCGLGALTEFTDFNGNVTRFGYDSLGRLTRIVKPGDSQLYPTQTFAYELDDPVSCIVTRSREVSRKGGTYDSHAYFDGLGRKLQTRSEAGNGKWVVTDAVTFNKRQQPKRKWLPYYDAGSAYGPPDLNRSFIESFYDPRGRIIKEVNPDGSFRATRYLPLEKQLWDEEDNRPHGAHADTPHSFTYDGLDRLVKVTERNRTEVYNTEYGYDGQNHLTSIQDDHGNLKIMRFDGLGRKIFMDDPDKGPMHYGYDKAGNLVRTQDNKNQVVLYSYDSANRIVTESHDGVRVRYHYDLDLPPDHEGLENTRGRLAYVQDEAGRVFFSYDDRGNVVLKGRRVAGTDYELIQTMRYDAMERLTSLIYPDGMKVSYLYNAGNQLESIPGYVDRIEYTASGQKRRFAYANGVESKYFYDTRQRLKGLKTTREGKLLQDLAYVYDGVSNIRTITDQRIDPLPESQTRTFMYDDLYRLTRAAAPGWHISYEYDSIGNLVSQTSDVSDSKVNLKVLSYGEGGAGPHAVTHAGPFKYAYDGNGNIASKAGRTFAFDHRDRLVGVNQDSDSAHGEYKYGYDGNRVMKKATVDGRSSTVIYLDKVAELRDGRLIEHVFAGDRRVARVSKPFDAGALFRTSTGSESPAALGTASTRFFIPDHLGNPAVVTDGAGKVVEQSTFYPYGMNRSRTGAFESEYRFTGKELDEESDLHYFGARYYDAMVGRFVSVDPLFVNVMVDNIKTTTDNQRTEYLNLYSYVSNNPLLYIDIQGLSRWNAFATATLDVGKTFAKAGLSCGKAFAGGMSLATGTPIGVAKGSSLVIGAFSDINDAFRYADEAGINFANAIMNKDVVKLQNGPISFLQSPVFKINQEITSIIGGNISGSVGNIITGFDNINMGFDFLPSIYKMARGELTTKDSVEWLVRFGLKGVGQNMDSIIDKSDYGVLHKTLSKNILGGWLKLHEEAVSYGFSGKSSVMEQK